MISSTNHLDKLRKAYPRLFIEEGMPWDFDHGPGWDQIIESLCSQIDSVLKDVPDAFITIRQVKEKMGTLRFYYRLQGVDAEHEQAIQDAVAAAYAASEQTCERCGNPGVLQETGRGLQTLCAACGGDNSAGSNSKHTADTSYPRAAYLASSLEEDRPVLDQALQWLQEEYAGNEVIPGPVSLLQNRFRIGYHQGLRIAQHLERLQIWKMQDDPKHGRIAIRGRVDLAHPL